MNTPKYSVCITHYNGLECLRPTITSILSQIDERFEVLIVDQNSTDGSLEYLKELGEKGLIRVFTQNRRCRGLGRQYAFEMSTGDYIISLDSDNILRPVLQLLLRLYHHHYEGSTLAVRGGITIAPRQLAVLIGGWRDLSFFEDMDFWARSARVGHFRHIESIDTVEYLRPFGRGRGILSMIRYRYEMFRDGKRLGMSVFTRVRDTPRRI